MKSSWREEPTGPGLEQGDAPTNTGEGGSALHSKQGPCGPHQAFLLEALIFWRRHLLGSSALELFIFFKERKCLN